MISKNCTDGTTIEMNQIEYSNSTYYVNDGSIPAIRHTKNGKPTFERHQILKVTESQYGDVRVELHNSAGPAIIFFDEEGNITGDSRYYIQGNQIGTYQQLKDQGLITDTGVYTDDFAFTIDMCGENFELLRKYIKEV